MTNPVLQTREFYVGKRSFRSLLRLYAFSRTTNVIPPGTIARYAASNRFSRSSKGLIFDVKPYKARGN
jgi:hypothetical protein